jgi:hypothetical protein
MHTNQTDRFKVASSTGNNWIIVLYDSVSNSSMLLVELMRYRTGTRILSASKILPARLVADGLQPRLQCLDTKCFKMFTRCKMFLTKETAIINIQLAPPSLLHRDNAVKCAIHTSKNVFIANLCSIDNDLHHQDYWLLMQQTSTNLEMLGLHTCIL